MKLVQSLASIFSRFTRAQQWSSEQAKAFILHHHQHHQHHHQMSGQVKKANAFSLRNLPWADVYMSSAM